MRKFAASRQFVLCGTACVALVCCRRPVSPRTELDALYIAGKRLESAVTISGGAQTAAFELLHAEFNAQILIASDWFQRDPSAGKRLRPFTHRYYKAARAYDTAAEILDLSSRFERCRILLGSNTCRRTFQSAAAGLYSEIFMAGLEGACKYCDTLSPATVTEILTEAVKLQEDADQHLLANSPD
jgi:hypothetical protein